MVGHGNQNSGMDGGEPLDNPRANVLGKYLNQSAESRMTEPEETTGYGCYGELPTKAQMLDLRQVDGNRTAFPYHFLEQVDFDASKGIILSFTLCTVTIRGHNLLKIFNGIVGQRIGYIQAVDAAFRDDGRDAAEPTVLAIILSTKMA